MFEFKRGNSKKCAGGRGAGCDAEKCRRFRHNGFRFRIGY
ncbi:hypothetical protein CLOSTASPAR_03194 [[Clostridium] asparagiforme DSM 15981]|uniref:Uncharacterized protein n=1 Tax=[Clostridium] asparagiforme DSM 15981 TaxID=518636 RepID=C0D1Q5_9FIRM|nr:hypothetical protein CLOSTASPAR_03194 [[Clostridium] asparagiforme DSM 15981]